MSERDDSYAERESMWDEAWPTSEGKDTHPGIEPDTTDEEVPFPDEVGTPDTIASVRDAEPYMAPTDPPVLPGGGEGVHMATGFGVSSEEETAREPAPQGDMDIQDEAMLLLRQDSLTSKYPLQVEVDRGFVYLRGTVPSTEDADHAMSILSTVQGVVDVVDETTVSPRAVE